MAGKLYVPVDVNFDDDDKIIDAGIVAEAVYQRMLRLAKRKETDGHIATAQARRICADIPAAVLDAVGDPVERLVTVGLLDRTDTGFVIGSWLDHNVSRAELDEKRRAEAERKARYRNRKNGQGTDATEDDESRDAGHDVASDGTESLATRSEVKCSEVKSSEVSPARARQTYGADFDEWWTHYPRKTDKSRAHKTYSQRRKEGNSHADLLAACEHYSHARAGQDPQFTKHAATFLAKDGPWTEWVNGNPDRVARPDPNAWMIRRMEQAS